MAAQPGREAQEPQREAGHLALDHGDVGEHRGLVTEQGALQQLGSQLDLVGGPLVGRQITHQLHHRRHVLDRGAADYRHLPLLTDITWNAIEDNHINGGATIAGYNGF